MNDWGGGGEGGCWRGRIREVEAHWGLGCAGYYRPTRPSLDESRITVAYTKCSSIP